MRLKLTFLNAQTAILRLLLKTETLADDVDLAKLAKDTATFSGSDLKRQSAFILLLSVADCRY